MQTILPFIDNTLKIPRHQKKKKKKKLQVSNSRISILARVSSNRSLRMTTCPWSRRDRYLSIYSSPFASRTWSLECRFLASSVGGRRPWGSSRRLVDRFVICSSSIANTAEQCVSYRAPSLFSSTRLPAVTRVHPFCLLLFLRPFRRARPLQLRAAGKTVAELPAPFHERSLFEKFINIAGNPCLLVVWPENATHYMLRNGV